MIELFKQAFPYLLLLFFLVRGFRNPIYFLGISFLMYMSESIFFETVKIFQVPGRILPALKLIWMVIFWILPFLFYLYVGKQIKRRAQTIGTLDYLVIFLMIVTTIGFITALIDYPVVKGVVMEFFILLSLFIGYFIIRDWSFSCSLEVLKGFLFSIIVINTISALFYILHQGASLAIYDIEEYIEEVFGGEMITRSFWFMPQFLFFSLAFLLVFRSERPVFYTLMLVINLGAIFITYSRSTLLVALFLIIIYFVILGIRENKMDTVLKNIFIYSIIAIMSIFVIVKIFPTNAKYFEDRFAELTEDRSPFQINSLQYRFERTIGVIEDININRIVFGMGPVTEEQEPEVPLVKSITSDLVWTGVGYRWGLIGFLLFILLYIYSFIKSFKVFMNNTGLMSNLAFMLMIVIISQVLEGITSWTFLSGHGYVTGLWYFALVAVLDDKATQMSKQSK